MASEAFHTPQFRGQFSGHETFPLRYGWLKKVVDAFATTESDEADSVFDPNIAIAKFGVGKNMVVSMKHWSMATGIIEQSTNSSPRLTSLGRELFADNGFDPYAEHPATLWLLHWNIASKPRPATTWYVAFNYFNNLVLEREQLQGQIERLFQERARSRLSPATLKRDVDCFIRSYVVGRSKQGEISEDSLECPLAELELMVPGAVRGQYQFQRGEKSTLPDGVFNHALWNFWKGRGTAETITANTLTHEPGSPGKIFKLDDMSIANRLVRIEETSHGVFRASDTGGLQQVQRLTTELDDELSLLRPTYQSQTQVSAA